MEAVQCSSTDDWIKEVWYIHRMEYNLALRKKEGFPGGAVVKNPPANAGDTGLIPGPGRSHMPRSS